MSKMVLHFSKDLEPVPHQKSCEFRPYLSQHAHILLKASNRDPTK
jgi:hypothetical protein